MSRNTFNLSPSQTNNHYGDSQKSLTLLLDTGSLPVRIHVYDRSNGPDTNNFIVNHSVIIITSFAYSQCKVKVKVKVNATKKKKKIAYDFICIFLQWMYYKIKTINQYVTVFKGMLINKQDLHCVLSCEILQCGFSVWLLLVA